MSENQEQQEETPVLTLPKAPFMGTKVHLFQHYGYWFHPKFGLKSIDSFQQHFRPRDTDVIIASHPKTGSTWLKALLFAVVNRFHHHYTATKLAANNPVELVHNLETGIYGESSSGLTFTYPQPHHLDELPSPRLFHTHYPYTFFPESITTSGCKILYIGRNPLDTMVSQWHFYPEMNKKLMGEDDFQPPYSIEDYFEDFCQGKISYGPFFDHVLEYWKLSLEMPEKVLFLKYEDLKGDNTASFHLKKLAEFVGFPFSDKEESEGVIEEIIQLCSIKNLKEMDVNKSGCVYNIIEKKIFFRKGQVGDWTNYFSPHLVERMNKLTEDKFRGTGLSFRLLPQ